jgi:hydrogenase nickel incorporation protein HypB
MRERVLRLNPKIRIFEISAKTGQGVEDWSAWLSGEAKDFLAG